MENNNYIQQKPTLSMSQAVSNVFDKYATFSGRARRSEYWWYWLFYLIVLFMAVFFDNFFGITFDYLTYGPIYVLAALGLILPTWAVAVRRLHDINKSGWNLLWSLVPIIGAILLLIWACTDSDRTANEYGESPKY